MTAPAAPAAPAPSRSPLRRRALVTLAVAVAAVLVAEGAVRILAPYLPPPTVWRDTTSAVKVAALDALAAAGECVDVVFVGTSMARDDLDPARFSAADPGGRRAYNAALDAATPTVLERWVPDVVVPRARPATVVVGVASFDLNDESPLGAAALASYLEAPATRPDWLGALDRWASSWSYLVRYRSELRDPVVVAEAVGRLFRRDPYPELSTDLVRADGLGLSRRDLSYDGDPGVQRFVRDELLGGFSVGGAQTEALVRLVGRLDDAGVETVLAILPTTEDYADLHPAGARDEAAFRAQLEVVAAETGARLVDASDVLPAGPGRDRLFADTHHLNARGADIVSDALPGLIGPGPRCSPSP